MFYKHYDYGIRYLFGVELVGLLGNGKEPVNPTKITTMRQLQDTRDALSSGKTHWRRISSAERSKLKALMDEGEQKRLRDPKQPQAGSKKTPKSLEMVDARQDFSEDDEEEEDMVDEDEDGGKDWDDDEVRDTDSDADSDEVPTPVVKKASPLKAKPAPAALKTPTPPVKTNSTGPAKAKPNPAAKRDPKPAAVKSKAPLTKKNTTPEKPQSTPVVTKENVRPEPAAGIGPVVNTLTMASMMGIIDVNATEHDAGLEGKKRKCDDEVLGKSKVQKVENESLAATRARRTVSKAAEIKRKQIIEAERGRS